MEKAQKGNLMQPYLVLQRHIDFKYFRLGDSLLSVRDIRNMVMMSVVFDNCYGSLQSQRI